MIIDTNLSSLKLALETVKITDKIRLSNLKLALVTVKVTDKIKLSGEFCRNSLLKLVPSEYSGMIRIALANTTKQQKC